MPHYRTIVISDVHLGATESKVVQLLEFLKENTCDNLILNGDIIDGWQLRRRGKWKKRHTRFFRFLLKINERKKTRIVYLRGNHDDFLDEIIPFRFGNIEIRRDFVYQSGARRYLVTHGDVFDSVSSEMRWLARLGDMGYTFLLWLNKVYNNRRERKGLPYYSLSKEIKHKVKRAVNFISDFEEKLAGFAKMKKCQGIICGHIHHPDIRMIDGIHYLNSGDWVETLSALVEDDKGSWKIKYHQETLEKEEKKKAYLKAKNLGKKSKNKKSKK